MPETPEPIFDAATEEMYQRLPEHFRRMDALNDWSMKNYINLMGIPLQEVDDLIEQIDFNPIDDGGEPGETSEMVNPNVAPARWLPWLAQLFGVRIGGAGTEQDREEVIAAASGFNAGTKEAIASAAKSVLVGEQYAAVYSHSNATIGAGGPWDLLLVTRASETLINLYPLIQSTLAETVSWTASGSPSATFTKAITRVPESLMLYNNYAMMISNTSGPTSTLTMTSSFKVAAVATDYHQTMLTLWSSNGVSYSGTLGIKYYNSGGTQLSSTTTAITVTGTPQQFNYGLNAPANTTHMTTFFTVNNVPQSVSIYAAQLGARHEVMTQWIAQTADPVATVIAKGAKPAGFKLWYNSSSADWDTVVAGFPTWSAMDGKSWEDLEESG